MALGWLLSLAPAADDIFKSVTNIFKSSDKRKKLIAEISDKFKALYAASIKGVQRDVALISGWKPIVARLQGIESMIRTWEGVLDLAREVDNPTLPFKVITKKRVENLGEQIREVAKKSREIGEAGSLFWREGGADVEGDLKRMADDAVLLERIVSQFEDRIEKKEKISEQDLFAIYSELSDMRGRGITVVTYYDNFLRELAEEAAKAPTHFQKGIPGQVEKTIEAKFDTSSWSDILTDVYKAINKDS